MIWFLTHSILSYSFNVSRFCSIVHFHHLSIFFFFWFMPKVFQTHVSRSTKYLFLKDDNLANAGQLPEISYLMRKILCMNIVSWLYASNKILQINPPKKAANTHFHKQRDNIKFFFLANKKTDFFFPTKNFSQISENLTLRGRFFLLPDLIQK